MTLLFSRSSGKRIPQHTIMTERFNALVCNQYARKTVHCHFLLLLSGFEQHHAFDYTIALGEAIQRYLHGQC